MDHHGNARLDVARGLSALVVFAAHISQVFIWPYLGAMSAVEVLAGTAAREAVLIFFLLSGFLITTSITKNITRNGYFEPTEYLVSRIARIYPPFLFALAIMSALYFIVSHFSLPGAAPPLGQLRPSGLTFTFKEFFNALSLHDGLTSINGPLWTLYIEAKIYIVAMGVALAVSGKSIPFRIIGAMVAILVVSTWIKTSYDPHGKMFWFLSTIWIMGAVASFEFARPFFRFATIGIMITVVCTWLSPIYASSYLDGNKTGLALQAVSCAIFAYVIMIRRWTEVDYPAWMRRSADYSYTLYVIHFPFLALGLSIAISFGVNSLFVSLLFALIFGSAALIAARLAARRLEDVPRYKGWLNSAFVRAAPSY